MYRVYYAILFYFVDYGIPLSQIKIVLFILANRECLIRWRRCIKIVKRCRIDTHTTQIHDLSLSWLCTGTLIKGCGVKLFLWTQISPDKVCCFALTFVQRICFPVHVHICPLLSFDVTSSTLEVASE
jgi:hypothetical protein